MKPITRYTSIAALAILLVVGGFGVGILRQKANQNPNTSPTDSLLTHPSIAFASYTEENWKSALTPEQYHILREAGTETPFTSPLLNEHRPGTFVTADCNEPVFRSEQKFDSGTGWPSFWAPIKPNAVVEKTDTSLFEERTEVLSKCGGHLGHVFPDGPPPTGLRYCMNGAALKFIPDPVK
jgi:peptide-methionine (R)-S-oxide reductase